MGNEERNVARMREQYRKWNDSRAGSAQDWLDMLADDVHWRSLSGGAPGLEFALECRNKDEVVRYFTRLTADWEMVHYKAEDFVAQGDRVVMIGSCAWRHRKTGKVVVSPKA